MIKETIGSNKDGSGTPPVAPAALFVAPTKQAIEVEDQELCTVLHGYGRVGPAEVHYIDNYKFVGGVCRHVPKPIAMAWAKGTRPDGKPAISRVFIQAVLPDGLENEEVEFAKVTGVQPLAPATLAAMINATDASLLVASMGRARAVELAEKLLQSSGQR